MIFCFLQKLIFPKIYGELVFFDPTFFILIYSIFFAIPEMNHKMKFHKCFSSIVGVAPTYLMFLYGSYKISSSIL